MNSTRIPPAAPPRRRLRLARSRCALLAACCTAIACSTDDATTLDWKGAVESKNGHPVTTNPATPALQPGTIRATPLWTAPSADVPDWAEPLKVVHGAGNYYLLDRRSTRIHIVAGDGRFVRSFGRRGPGPGEIMTAGDIGFVAGHVVVRDMGKRTFELYTPDGSFAKSIALGRVGFGFATIEPDAIIAAAVGRGGQSWIRIGLEGTEAPLPVPKDVSPNAGADACTDVTTFGDRIAQLDCAIPIVTVSTQAGAVERVIVIHRDSIFSTEAQVQAIREQLQRDIAANNLPPQAAQGILESTTRTARVITPWRSVRQDTATGVIAAWEQTPADFGGGNARLHLLSADGVYLDAIDFDRAWMDFTIHGSRIAALAVNDSTGLPELTLHSIELPPNTLKSAAAAASARKAR